MRWFPFLPVSAVSRSYIVYGIVSIHQYRSVASSVQRCRFVSTGLLLHKYSSTPSSVLKYCFASTVVLPRKYSSTAETTPRGVLVRENGGYSCWMGLFTAVALCCRCQRVAIECYCLSFGLLRWRSLSRWVFFSRFRWKASVRFTPVWLARQRSTQSTSAISSAGS